MEEEKDEIELKFRVQKNSYSYDIIQILRGEDWKEVGYVVGRLETWHTDWRKRWKSTDTSMMINTLVTAEKLVRKPNPNHKSNYLYKVNEKYDRKKKVLK